MAGRLTLDQVILVRIQVPQPESKAPSTSGLGRNPLKVKTRVRIPLGLPIFTVRKYGTYIKEVASPEAASFFSPSILFYRQFFRTFSVEPELAK